MADGGHLENRKITISQKPKGRQRDDKSPLKGAWFGSRDPFLHAQLWT